MTIPDHIPLDGGVEAGLVERLKAELTPERHEQIMANGWDKAIRGLIAERNAGTGVGDQHRLIAESWMMDGKNDLIDEAADRIEALERQLAKDERILRASVPDRFKSAASPVGAVQGYIASMERQLATVREATIEEAAKVADAEAQYQRDLAKTRVGGGPEYRASMLDGVSIRIRSLKSNEAPKVKHGE